VLEDDALAAKSLEADSVSLHDIVSTVTRTVPALMQQDC
jgi:hypothetical protein